MDGDASAPRPADGVQEPPVRGPAAIADADPGGDDLLVGAANGRIGAGLVRVLDRQREHALPLAAEHGEDAVRRQRGQRFGVVEPVGELGARVLLARNDRGDQPSALPQPLAQLADDVGVLGEPLDEDRPGALERRRDVGHALLGVHVRGGLGVRVAARVLEQAERERLEARLAGDLRLGAPLGLVRQVDVLEPRLGVRGEDLRLELRRQLALGAHRLQDHGAPLLELAQVAEPLVEVAEHRVVEAAGDLLAVPGDERHGRAGIEQVDRGADLRLPHAELARERPEHALLGAGDRHLGRRHRAPASTLDAGDADDAVPGTGGAVATAGERSGVVLGRVRARRRRPPPCAAPA